MQYWFKLQEFKAVIKKHDVQLYYLFKFTVESPFSLQMYSWRKQMHCKDEAFEAMPTGRYMLFIQ